VRIVDQELLEFPHVPAGEPPVVALEFAEVDQRIAGEPAGEVHVRIVIAPHQVADRAEHRFPAVQAGVARSRHRTPPAAVPEEEEHVIEVVLRLQADHQRRIAVPLHDNGGDQRRLHAMRFAIAEDLPEGTKRGTHAVVVVPQAKIQEPLNLARRPAGIDDDQFFAREGAARRRLSAAH